MNEFTPMVPAPNPAESPGCHHIDNSRVIISQSSYALWVLPPLPLSHMVLSSCRIFENTLFHCATCGDLGSIISDMCHTELMMEINFQLLPEAHVSPEALDLVWNLENKCISTPLTYL